jgi:hypothetical protein
MLLSHLDGGRFYLDSNGKTKHGLHPLSCFPPSGEPDLAVVAVHGRSKARQSGVCKSQARTTFNFPLEGHADKSNPYFLD